MRPVERDYRANRYLPARRERALQTVPANGGGPAGRPAAILADAPKIRCNRETLRRPVAGTAVDGGGGLPQEISPCHRERHEYTVLLGDLFSADAVLAGGLKSFGGVYLSTLVEIFARVRRRPRMQPTSSTEAAKCSLLSPRMRKPKAMLSATLRCG